MSPRPASLPLRRGLLLVAGAAGLTGVFAGLARLGVTLGFGPAYAASHGPLLGLGLLGTVIALERAVALGSAYAYVAAVLGAIAAMAMLFELAFAAAATAAMAFALVVVNAFILRRQRAPFTWMMLVGSLVLAAGTLAWAGGYAIHDVVPSWIAFFVLTIAAERLEMSRLSPAPPWATRVLVVAAAAAAALSLAVLFGLPGARRGFGVAMAAIGLWQLRFDLARRLLFRPGLPRFIAAAVLAGAAWLVVGGIAFAAVELGAAGLRYDAALHAVLVGYVLSMIFAHAPVILPAVARVALQFTRWLYAPLIVLHAGLLLRVLGDWTTQPELRRTGGVLNAIALAAYVAIVVAGRLRRAAAAPLNAG